VVIGFLLRNNDFSFSFIGLCFQIKVLGLYGEAKAWHDRVFAINPNFTDTFNGRESPLNLLGQL
jgi:hypothetical protein